MRPAQLAAGVVLLCAASESISASLAAEPAAPVLPGTKPLTLEGDVASALVDGVDRFLLDELDKSIERRAGFWNRDPSSPEKYNASIEPNRKRLAHILGVRDPRVPFDGLELVETTAQPALVGRGEGYKVLAVRWPAFGDVYGEGLLLTPTGRKPIADVIAVPDADQTPEMIVGLEPGVAPESQFARRLAESGCRVLVPVLINRQWVVPALVDPKVDRIGRVMPLTNRELLYRSAFELGRHLIGYELQKVLAGVDFFSREAGQTDARIAVVGWGEGGMLALYAAALDRRIDAALISGHFSSRQNLWREPIERNVFGLLEQFGDAELAAMIAPRTLVVEAAKGPEVVVVEQKTRGGPGRLIAPQPDDVRREVRRAGELAAGLRPAPAVRLVESRGGFGPYGSDEALQALLGAVSPGAKLAAAGDPPKDLRQGFDPRARHDRQVHELVRHSQWLLGESPYVRKRFLPVMDERNRDPISLEQYGKTIEPYRRKFYDEIIGRFDYPLAKPNVRSRKSYDEPRWTGYEVVMDVFPNVIAYGVLLVPKDAKPGDKRPVVVCQHGLEGRPQDVISGDHRAYHDFAAKLAERGMVTFAPQNLYIFKDRFRTLQRKANPLGKTLFSVIVPQHQQIVDWLQTLPCVDPERIAFYGLSYGGKTAMRVPPLVTDYCLSICSADFNEWVWKNAATNTEGRYSYVWTGEYEIFEFDLGSTFNYAEMAALIAPRPFMVERGHFDGVAPDETVAYEFAKVRHLYAARLGIADRCRIEWFVGPHTIHGVGTFDFLHEHLRWRKPNAAEE
ncbi:MAG: dienelactone hydrolase family protein [Planctomycetota bacterium]